MYDFRAQFKDISYAFCAMLYGLIDENSIIHKTSFEGFHIKIEKFFKTGMYFKKLIINIYNNIYKLID